MLLDKAGAFLLCQSQQNRFLLSLGTGFLLVSMRLSFASFLTSTISLVGVWFFVFASDIRFKKRFPKVDPWIRAHGKKAICTVSFIYILLLYCGDVLSPAHAFFFFKAEAAIRTQLEAFMSSALGTEAGSDGSIATNIVTIAITGIFWLGRIAIAIYLLFAAYQTWEAAQEKKNYFEVAQMPVLGMIILGVADFMVNLVIQAPAEGGV
jgi:preprotein translocase subunit Sss1